MDNYVLITPIKNEEKYISLVANCVINQTILPCAWIIVDGNSSDNSLNILEKLSSDYNWIYFKKQENITNQKNHLNFSIGVKEGYDYAKCICQTKKIKFNYVGKIDADQIISNTFFERLIDEFEQDPLLGVVSGKPFTLKQDIDLNNHGLFKRENCKADTYFSDELPDKRLYRRTYLEELNGFPISKYSPDTVLLAKFRMKGIHIKMCDDVPIYNLRSDTGTERDLWKSSLSYGRNRHYLNYNPMLVMANTLFLLLKKPYYLSVAFLLGYLSSLVRKNEKIDDKEIQIYFMNYRFKEIKSIFLKRLSSSINNKAK